jgi:hypothetical protein
VEAAENVSPDRPEAKRDGGGASGLLVMCGLAAVVFAVVATAGLLCFGWPQELVVALYAMAGFVVVETLVLFLWARPYVGGGVGGVADLGDAYADAAKVAITTQGVVLGLVAFQEGRLPNATLKVGAVALAVGVLTAAVLYLSVAFGPPPDRQRAYAAAVLFSLAYWCLGFGLICVVAGTWA